MDEKLNHTFEPKEQDRLLHALAKEYHDDCELYDRVICSRVNERGIAVPINDYEMRQINRNALAVKNRILKSNPDIDRNMLSKAIQKYARF